MEPTFTTNANSAEYAIATVPSEYRPKNSEVITLATFSSNNVIMRINGLNINAYNFNKTVTGVSCTATYPY